MKIAISKITVRADRREIRQDQLARMTTSLATVGLLNPILVDRDYMLISGLYRLRAAKLLGWTSIECRVCNLTGLRAELAEIDENLFFSAIPALERGKLISRRKELYKRIYPESNSQKSAAGSG